ncbi:MAG: SRPBCC domain-containing protein [Pseudomonadales bacterium]|nr:SRPBCC domain-containing protein [Pseudomonadales bacterium]
MTKIISVEPSILTKNYQAPIELVYKAWTEEAQLCKWQAPNNEITCEYQYADIRAGGTALHKMTMPNGNAMWLLTQYHELKSPDTIVFTQYESNESGDILAPKMPNWPKEIRATIKLNELNGTTSMQFIWQPINPTQEEADAWEASRAQHGQGWGGGFEMLANYLANL